MGNEEGVLPSWGLARERYVQSFYETTDRLKETFRTNVRDRFRASMNRSNQKRASKNAASVATGLVAARVFKGNLVVARMAKSACLKVSGASYSSPAGSSEGRKTAGKGLAVVIAAAGASVAAQEPAQAEATQLDETLASKVSEVYEAIKLGAQGRKDQMGKEKRVVTRGNGS
jgi:hypothetical protein